MLTEIRGLMTRGVSFFLSHALDLLARQGRGVFPGDPFAEPLTTRVHRLSAIFKLSSVEPEVLSCEEAVALCTVLRTARDLAAAARVDPRWANLALRLGVDVVREIDDILQSPCFRGESCSTRQAA